MVRTATAAKVKADEMRKTKKMPFGWWSSKKMSSTERRMPRFRCVHGEKAGLPQGHGAQQQNSLKQSFENLSDGRHHPGVLIKNVSLQVPS